MTDARTQRAAADRGAVSSSPIETRRKGIREFLLDNSIVALTQLLLKLRGLLALPLIVKSLGTEGYGLWVQVLSVVTFGAAFLSMNLHMALVRFVAGNAADAKRLYATTLACTVALGMLGAAILVPVASGASAALLGGAEHADLIRACAVLIVLHNVKTLNVNLYRATGRFVVRSAVDFLSVVLELGGILLVLAAGYGLSEVVLFMIAWNGLIMLGTTIHALTIVGVAAPTLQGARHAMTYALPMLPGAAAWWAIDRSDRFVIGHYLGPREVGIYSAAYALGALVLHYQVPFQITLMPRVAEFWDNDRQRAKQYIEACTKAFLALAIPTVVGLPIVAPLVLRDLANDEIAAGSAIVATIVGAGVVLQGLAIMQTQIFFGAKRTGTNSLAMVVGAVVTVVLTFALVPTFGILGAAIATSAGYLVLWLVLVWAARSVLRVDHQPLFVLKCLLSAGGMVCLLWLLRPHALPGLLLALIPSVAVYFAGLWALRVLSNDERAVLARMLPYRRG